MSFSVGYSTGNRNGSPHSRTSMRSSTDRSVLSMDEAYRRLGHKLSQRVTSGEEYRVSIALDLGSHPFTAFSSNPQQVASTTHANQLWNRSHKMAKMKYSDHGSHQQQLSEDSLLKKLTCHAKATFRAVESSKHSPENKGIKKRMSPIGTPQRSGLASIEQQSHESDHNQYTNNINNKGLLGSVLVTPPERKCLTQPKGAVSNDGMDNSEGNLVLFEGDIIQPTNVHTLKGEGIGILRVIDLLGQGTFAQVFLCECLDRPSSHGRRIALKVVKNKQAYTRQAAIEIDVFRALSDSKVNMVQLESYFVYQNHLCLVFELLGLNLYEVLKRRQFRGLPLATVRSLLRQAIDAVKDLSAKSIVHCDLKPENILLNSNDENVDGRTAQGNTSPKNNTTPSPHETKETTHARTNSVNTTDSISQGGPKIKLIDFGSACFEGNTTHTYIQSRFYRSPEVLVGLPYDSAIDMWSLGCVAAELFLGLPILPGVHEHDQLGRISEMIAPLPDWMLEQGSKSTKYFAKEITRPSSTDPLKVPTSQRSPSPSESDDQNDMGCSSLPPARPSWRIKTQQEYIRSLSASEIRKKGGLTKLEKQPANRYFKRKKLSDIIVLHGKATSNEEKETLGLLVHFLLGILDPDPWKRWTAFQASQHPFLTGSTSHLRTNECQKTKSNNDFGINWVPPWDPSICRRKLLNVQKTREKQQSVRRTVGSGRHPQDSSRMDIEMRSSSDTVSTVLGGSGSTNTSTMTAFGDTLSRQSTSNTMSGSDQTSPPSTLGISLSAQAERNSSLTGSLGSVLGMHQADASGGLSQEYLGPPQNLADYGQLPGVVEARIPASLIMASTAGFSYGEASVPRNLSMIQHSGPQSYSGMSYNGSMGPVEAEFGYALQRPGNVPSSHELSGSYSSVGQHSVASSIGFSPLHHHLQQPHSLPSRSMPGISSQIGHNGRNNTVPMIAGGSSRRGSRHRYNNAPMPSMAQSCTMMHNAPTSIREDSTDYQLGGGEGSSFTSGASLLAQQLEEQAAIARDALHVAEVQYHLRNHPTYARPPVYTGPAAVSAPQHGHGYYTTYVTADGTPFVASSLDMQHTNLSHGNMGHINGGPAYHPGNFSDQHAPIQAIHQRQYHQGPQSVHHGSNGSYAPNYIGVQQLQYQHQQPTMEQLERARQKEAGLPPGSAYHRGLSM